MNDFFNPPNRRTTTGRQTLISSNRSTSTNNSRSATVKLRPNALFSVTSQSKRVDENFRSPDLDNKHNEARVVCSMEKQQRPELWKFVKLVAEDEFKYLPISMLTS